MRGRWAKSTIMRKVIVLLLLFNSLTSLGQNAPKAIPDALRPVKAIPDFVDSLKRKLMADTAKYSRSDIIHTAIGSRNTKSYSTLFFVNMKYQYMLDIVNGDDVSNFLREILDVDKIESVNLMNSERSQSLFGIRGKNGAIIIQLKEGAVVNFVVAGLKIDKGRGNNFYQIKNEIIVRD